MNANFALTLVAMITLSGCGKKDYKPEPASRESCRHENKMYVDRLCVAGSSSSPGNVRYRLLETPSFTQVFTKDRIDICLLTHDEPRGREEVLKGIILEAIGTWLEPLKGLGYVPPPIHVTRTTTDPEALPCAPNTDAFVHLRQELDEEGQFKGRAHANHRTSEIWLSFTDIDPGTVLHEFGHLFGLADTYVENKWDCRPEFPNSLMCDSSWETLLPVDREQIQRLYCLETDGAAAACFNHTPREFLALKRERRGPGNSPARLLYLECADDSSRFEIEGTALTRVGTPLLPRSRNYATPERFYSTDAHSVVESHEQGKMQIEFRIEDIDQKAIVPTFKTIRLQIDESLALVEFDDYGEVREYGFTECYFAPDVIQYLAQRSGFSISAPIFAHNDFNRLALSQKPKTARLSGEGTFASYWIQHNPRRPADTIHVFSSEKNLIRKMPVLDAAVIKGSDLFTEVTVEVAKLGLPAGDYILIFARDSQLMALGNLNIP